MKLVHPELRNQIVFDSHNVYEWIIESPQLFAEYVQALYEQIEGGEGKFVLSESEKEMNISKCMEMILNPFAVNLNDKKILNKVYSELATLSGREDIYLSTQEIGASIQKYFLELEQLVPYALEMEPEVDITNLLKAIGVRIEDYTENFWERLNLYVKLVSELMQKKIVVFVNIRSYINDTQVEQLIENAAYNEVALLFIENNSKSKLQCVSRYIIDSDGCEIY